MTISIIMLYNYAAECLFLFTIMLNVVMLNVVMMSVVMLSVVMLSVVAPMRRASTEYDCLPQLYLTMELFRIRLVLTVASTINIR